MKIYKLISIKNESKKSKIINDIIKNIMSLLIKKIINLANTILKTWQSKLSLHIVYMQNNSL